jgi:hypothetical protein
MVCYPQATLSSDDMGVYPQFNNAFCDMVINDKIC